MVGGGEFQKENRGGPWLKERLLLGSERESGGFNLNRTD